MRGTSMMLVADGGQHFSVYDEADDSLILRGIVGEASVLDLPGGGRLVLFVSMLQVDDGQVYWISRGSRIGAIRSLQGRLSVQEKAEWSGILSISVEGPDPEAVRADLQQAFRQRGRVQQPAGQVKNYTAGRG